MKLARLLIISLLALLLIPSCETEIDLEADWKEIPVVYGLLNQNDSIHYIRIQKAYLGKGNIMQMALEPDSNLYPNILDVIIEEWSNNQLVRTISLDTMVVDNKEEGIFFHPYQPVYFTTQPISYGNIYKLSITNTVSGKNVTSQTELVSDFSIKRPFPGVPLNFKVRGSSTTTFIWAQAKNAGRYQMKLRFNYLEVDQSLDLTTAKYVEWNSSIIKTTGSSSTSDIELAFLNDDFFRLVENGVLLNVDVIRYPVNFELIFYVAGTDFSTYMEVNEPSSSVIQEKPLFSNISEGVGIFSARYNKRTVHPIHPFTVDSLTKMEGYNFYQLPQ